MYRSQMITTTPTAPTTSGAAVLPSTRVWLRLEAVAAFAAGLALYGLNGGPWLLVVPLLLVPDVSMVGYLRDARLGAFTYNLVHNWALGLAVLGMGAWSGIAWVVLAGAILIAHVGMDRALGYGLKGSSFHDTHLGPIGKGRRGA
jgi:Domain of unknown function (DUF4260)